MVSRYFLDTNAVISLFNGDGKIANILKDSQWIGLSVISEIEFLAYDRIIPEEIDLFYQFAERVEMINLSGNDKALIQECIKVRKINGLKLPDAIIAAQAKNNDAILITDVGFNKVESLSVYNYLKIKDG